MMRRKRLLIGALVIGAMATAIMRLRQSVVRIEFESIQPDQLLDDGSTYIDLDGLRVRTLVCGSGSPAIVLLHGFAASVFTWHKVVDELAKHGTVIAFDRPGYGFTSRPSTRSWTGHSPYSMEASVDLTTRILDHFHVDRAVLIGHSAGGTVAALAALEHPERLNSLVLVAPAVYFDVPPPEWLHRLVESGVMQRCGPSIARGVARFTLPIMRRVWHDPSLITPDVVEGYLAPFRCIGWGAGMWEVVRANRETRLGTRISSLSVPTKIITGDHDRVVPAKQSIRAAHEIPGARLAVIPECGHIPQEERPEAFLSNVTEFIRIRAE